MFITPMKQRELLNRAIQKVRRKNEIAKIRHADKPDFSESSLPPLDIRKVKFQYTKPDYSHHGSPELLTEDEIIDSCRQPNSRFHIKASDLKLGSMAVCEEVKDYWRNRIGQSLLRRGKAYKNV